MRYLIFVLFLIPFATGADPRLEVNNTGGLVHFPISFEDADDELFGADAGPQIFVIGGVANGGAEWSRRATKRAHPYVLGTTAYNDSNTGFVCNMVDSNGQTYTSNDWNAYVTVSEHTEWTDNLYFSLRCYNGQAQ